MIKNKTFSLKPTQTKLKTADGRVFIEEKDKLIQVSHEIRKFSNNVFWIKIG